MRLNSTIELSRGQSNTEYAGWAVTARIPVKFGTTHGKWRPDVGSTKRIDAYDRKGVTPAPRIFGTSDEEMMKTQLLLAYCL